MNITPSISDASALREGEAGEGGARAAAEAPLLSADSPVLKNVPVTLDARLGGATMSIEELLALHLGSVLTLEKQLNEPADLYLNQTLVARGEIVAVGDRFGIRIVEVASR